MNNCSYLFYQPYQHFSDNFTVIGNVTVYYSMSGFFLYANAKF